jgi:hypothetical protein
LRKYKNHVAINEMKDTKNGRVRKEKSQHNATNMCAPLFSINCFNKKIILIGKDMIHTDFSVIVDEIHKTKAHSIFEYSFYNYTLAIFDIDVLEEVNN